MGLDYILSHFGKMKWVIVSSTLEFCHECQFTLDNQYYDEKRDLCSSCDSCPYLWARDLLDEDETLAGLSVDEVEEKLKTYETLG